MKDLVIHEVVELYLICESTVTKAHSKNDRDLHITNYSLLSNKTACLLHPSVPCPNAASSASSIVRTKQNCISRRISGETSCSTSFLFAHGRITLRICARWAPRTFIRIPPTAVTRPRSVICRKDDMRIWLQLYELTSPVIATSFETVAPLSNDTKAHV